MENPHPGVTSLCPHGPPCPSTRSVCLKLRRFLLHTLCTLGPRQEGVRPALWESVRASRRVGKAWLVTSGENVSFFICWSQNSSGLVKPAHRKRTCPDPSSSLGHETRGISCAPKQGRAARELARGGEAKPLGERELLKKLGWGWHLKGTEGCLKGRSGC